MRRSKKEQTSGGEASGTKVKAERGRPGQEREGSPGRGKRSAFGDSSTGRWAGSGERSLCSMKSLDLILGPGARGVSE